MVPFEKVQIASPAFKVDPQPFYRRLRSEAPVCRVRLPNKQEAWLVSRYDDVLNLLKDRRFVKNRRSAMTVGQQSKEPWVPPVFAPLLHNMLDQDDPDHARLRVLVHKVFTPGRVAQMTDRIQMLSDTLLDNVAKHGNIDLIRDFALPLPVTVIADLLGVPVADRTKFVRWSNTLIKNSAASWDLLFSLPDLLAFVRYIKWLVQLRRHEPQDDLVTALVQVKEGNDRFSEDELISMIAILLSAGHETTVNLIGNGVLALVQHPEQQERLRTEPFRIKTAIEELLRFGSPVEMATHRYASEDITVAGSLIPRGTLVFGVIGSANRDEHQFPDPDTLDIARDPNRHLALGQGVHYCLGAPLARLEGQIAINTLLRRYSDLRLTQAPEQLRWRRGLILRGLESLPLQVSP